MPCCKKVISTVAPPIGKNRKQCKLCQVGERSCIVEIHLILSDMKTTSSSGHKLTSGTRPPSHREGNKPSLELRHSIGWLCA
jgi:hypothetical protein